jgi:hypothetical protein
MNFCNICSLTHFKMQLPMAEVGYYITSVVQICLISRVLRRWASLLFDSTPGQIPKGGYANHVSRCSSHIIHSAFRFWDRMFETAWAYITGLEVDHLIICWMSHWQYFGYKKYNLNQNIWENSFWATKKIEISSVPLKKFFFLICPH